MSHEPTPAQLIAALERLVRVGNLISNRLHILGRDMGFAGAYDGNYPCSAWHVELDMATQDAEELILQHHKEVDNP